MKNPFLDNKLDYEKEPVLWFSPYSETISGQGKPTFVNGTRGSGKTAILRSLSTRYISEIPSLKQQLEGKRKNWFGTYVRLQDSYADFLGVVEDNGENDAETQQREYLVFSQYTEFMIVAQLLDDLIELKTSGYLKFSLAKEAEAVAGFAEDVAAVRYYAEKLRSDDKINNIRTLRRLISDTIGAIFDSAVDFQGSGSFQLKATIPGAIITSATKRFISIIRSDYLVQGKKLTLKVLVDDCEVLSRSAQSYLNTLMKTTQLPVSWVIAYVSNTYDTRTTVRNSQMISDADRLMIKLDHMKADEFKNLCFNIAALRIYQCLPREFHRKLADPDPLKSIDLRARLGKLSLNQIISEIRPGSINEGWSEIDELTRLWDRILKPAPLTHSSKDDLEVLGDVLPYTVAIAAREMGITPQDAETSLVTADDSRRFARKLARKQRAAFLLLFKQLQIQPTLAGERIILAISDGCVRDFLDIMREIVDRAVPQVTERSIFKFAHSKKLIPIKEQSIAIHAASDKKFDGVKSASDPYGNEVARIIEGLGLLTHRLQVNGRQGIVNPEIGVFEVNWHEVQSLLADFGISKKTSQEIMKSASVDGFLREVNKSRELLNVEKIVESEKRYFRLHSRFAPKYRFSFQGPYSIFRLQSSLFCELIIGARGLELNGWVERAVKFTAVKDFDPKQSNLPGVYDE